MVNFFYINSKLYIGIPFSIGMTQEKLDSHLVEGYKTEDVVKLVKSEYQNMLKDIARGDCNVVYYGGKIVSSIDGCREPDSYKDAEERLTICGEISYRIFELITKRFGNIAHHMTGQYVGGGANFSQDQSGEHVFVVLSNGTILDGAFKQYQNPSLKRRKNLVVVKPTDPEYGGYKFNSSHIKHVEDSKRNGTPDKYPLDNVKITNIPKYSSHLYWEDGKLFEDAMWEFGKNVQPHREAHEYQLYANVWKEVK